MKALLSHQGPLVHVDHSHRLATTGATDEDPMAPKAPRYPKHGPLVHNAKIIIDTDNSLRYTLPLRSPDTTGGNGVFVTKHANDARIIAHLIENNEIRQFKVERPDGAIVFLVGNMVSKLITTSGPRDEEGVTYRDAFDSHMVTVIANNAKDRQDFEITITSEPGRAYDE